MAFLKKIFSGKTGTDPEESNVSAEAASMTPAEPAVKPGMFQRLKSRLTRTSSTIVDRIENLVPGRTEIDDEMLDEIEEILFAADLGVKTTTEVMDRVRTNLGRRLKVPADLRPFLRDELLSMISVTGSGDDTEVRQPPEVILIIGVNGSGKTTTTGKLAYNYIKQGKKVVLAAADTFRAAAIEQLQMWAERSKAHLIKHQHGADPSAVAYDATKSALSREADILIIDTAGRLHTKSNLMDELGKIARVVSRDIHGAPHETWLVLDGTSGQNALNQARQFLQTVNITGFILTKLDSTSKGGAIISIIRELKVPVKYIGIGEDLEDLQPFDAERFIDAIFGENDQPSQESKYV